MSRPDESRPHCCYCPKETDLRPYGPGGSLICFACGTSAEHESETKANFGAILDAAESISPLSVAVISAATSPQPLVDLADLAYKA